MTNTLARTLLISRHTRHIIIIIIIVVMAEMKLKTKTDRSSSSYNGHGKSLYYTYIMRKTASRAPEGFQNIFSRPRSRRYRRLRIFGNREMIGSNIWTMIIR